MNERNNFDNDTISLSLQQNLSNSDFTVDYSVIYAICIQIDVHFSDVREQYSIQTIQWPQTL